MASRQPEAPAPETGHFREGTAIAAGAIAGGALAFALATGIPTFGVSDDVSKLIWYAIRVSGVGAYLLLWATTVAGICISGGYGGKRLNPILYPLHQLGDLALSLTVLHGALLLGDRYAGFTPLSIAVPFLSEYRPFWIALGILSLYVAVVVFWSVEIRPRVGYPAWKRIHLAGFVAYALALAHGLGSGTDSETAVMRLVYFATGQLVIVLVGLRIRQAQRAAKVKRSGPAPERRRAGESEQAISSARPTPS